MIRTGHPATLLAGAVLVGCFVGCFVDNGADTAGAGDTGASTSGAQSTGATTDATTGTGTASDGVTSGPGASTGAAQTDGCGSMCASTGEPVVDCDVFAQDCPPGQKCAPYSSDGGGTWEAAKCVPMTGTRAPGQPCNSQGSHSGVDNCQVGALCWDPTAQGQGICVTLCQGSQAAPMCPDPTATHCTVLDAGALELCLPVCDPLIQDCANDDLCVFMSEQFVCIYDAEVNAGAVFDPCERINGCDKGLLCLSPSAAKECDPNAGGCCLPLCSVMENGQCPGEGQSCVPFFAQGMAPPGDEDIGVCALPE